jgi:hypothetical protein
LSVARISLTSEVYTTVVLPVDLCESKFSDSNEHTVRVSQNGVLRCILGFKRDEVSRKSKAVPVTGRGRP